MIAKAPACLLASTAWLGTLACGKPVELQRPPNVAPSEPMRCGDYASCELACHEGLATGCTDLARLFESGQGVPQNLSHAAELFASACQMRDRDACAHLALMYDVGLGVSHDVSYAAFWYETACALGDQWSCERKRRLQTPQP